MSTLIQTRAAWRLVRQWATDFLSFPELEKSLLNLGSYDYEEWRDVFKKVEVASDPTEDHPISPIDIVIEEARGHGIILTEEVSSPASILLGSHRPRSPSQEPRQSQKRRKLGVSKYLDLSAWDDETDDSFDSDDEIGRDILRSSEVGRAGLHSFAKHLDYITHRYGTNVRPPAQVEAESSVVSYYFIDFYSVHTARYVLEVLKPRLPGALLLPWLPRRLYLQASSPLAILSAMSPSHRSMVRDVTLVPPAEAARIFAPEATLPCRCWVRIRKGKYRNDLGYVLSREEDFFSVLVGPRERPYDPPGGPPNTRALFDWQTAYDAGLELTVIENSLGVTAFRHKEASYFAGLLRVSLTAEDLERLLMPHPDQFLLHAQAGIDSSLTEEAMVLFSAQFWVEGDVVRSSSPELLNEIATVAAVDLQKQSVILISDKRQYHCSLLEQRRVFALGDQLRITAGHNHGCVGGVVSVSENELVLCLSTDLSREVHVSQYFVETCRPDHRCSPHGPELQQLYRPPEPTQTDIQAGDLARVLDGPHRGLRGYIDWINEDSVWITVPEDPKEVQLGNQDLDGLGPSLACVKRSTIVSNPVAGILNFTKEKGYDVSVGDGVRVARGPFWGRQGLVNKVRWTEGRLDVVLQDGITATVPITSCVKVANFCIREASKLVGKEVWVVGGEFKGRRATLHSLGRARSVVSMPARPAQEISNHHIAAPSGVLLTGGMLHRSLLHQLMRLIRKSFVPVQKVQTPPPSPRPLSSEIPSMSDESAEDPAWTITLDDSSTPGQPAEQSPDYGEIPWIFNDAFCDFAKYHLAFNVDPRFKGGALHDRVAQTTCPDRFCWTAGGRVSEPAPPGHVSVTVPGHNKGSQRQRYNIPAKLLTPALPQGGKNKQQGLILVGNRAGQIHPIGQYSRKRREVELAGSWYSCKDVCPAYLFNP